MTSRRRSGESPIFLRIWLAGLPLRRVSLELVECPDRRLARAVLQVVAEELHDGNTEVSVLVPRHEYSRLWHRLLHDRTSDTIARVVSRLPHANVTFVPYHLGEPVGPTAVPVDGLPPA